jgi:hypothetical protein
MIPFALLLNHAFPYHEFMTTDTGKRVVDSVREMLGVGDVIQDAYHSFMPSYQVSASMCWPFCLRSSVRM